MRSNCQLPVSASAARTRAREKRASGGRELRAEGKGQRAKGKERRAKSEEQRAKGRGGRKRPTPNAQRPTSNERAKSSEEFRYGVQIARAKGTRSQITDHRSQITAPISRAWTTPRRRTLAANTCILRCSGRATSSFAARPLAFQAGGQRTYRALQPVADQRAARPAPMPCP